MCRRTLLVLWHEKQIHPSEHSPGDQSARLWDDTTPDAHVWRGSDYPRREHTSPLSTSPTREERQAQLLLCPANCACKNSLQRLAGKFRIVKDYGPRSGNAELVSNTCIAEGDIVAIFVETATI